MHANDLLILILRIRTFNSLDRISISIIILKFIMQFLSNILQIRKIFNCDQIYYLRYN